MLLEKHVHLQNDVGASREGIMLAYDRFERAVGPFRWRLDRFGFHSLDANVKDVKESNVQSSRSSFTLLPCKHLSSCIVTPLLKVSCGAGAALRASLSVLSSIT